ncbi:hypothetical protein B0H14DRAFT_2569416 [Mycena olivaceomarginata]|nr:hypothetical protein B0H14DRAFT_2569416 [Mycena olivaceomarginata]
MSQTSLVNAEVVDHGGIEPVFSPPALASIRCFFHRLPGGFDTFLLILVFPISILSSLEYIFFPRMICPVPLACTLPLCPIAGSVSASPFPTLKFGYTAVDRLSPARFCRAAVTLRSAFFEPTAQISIQLARRVDATRGVRRTADVTVNSPLDLLPARGHHEW